jgi:VanZ family protein
MGIFRITRRPLRYFTLWRVIGWLIVAAIVYGSLTPTPINIPVNQGDKLGHMFSYAALMGWFMQLYIRESQLRLAAWCVALGVLMEYAQLVSGYRDFEYLDMVADAVGVSIAWVLGGTALSRVLTGLERRMERQH